MEPFERLDEAMNERRLELRMNWRQVAEAADISYTALRAIRRGDYRPAELTARGIDEALKWPPGTVSALLGGAAAPPSNMSDGETPASPADRDPTLSRELELARRLLAATVREMNLSPEEADEVWKRVRLEIEVTHRSHTGDTGSDDRNDRAG